MNIHTKELLNGITVGADFMEHVHTACISVLVKAGSRNENIENNGISHFLEHMAFKGTTSRKAQDIAEQFDNIGGYYNAYTSREKTVYYAKVLKNDMAVAIDILSDILQNSTYEAEEIAREREVILQEIAQTNDNPDDTVFDAFQNTAYSDQALGMSILGSTENVLKFGKQDITDYIQENYSYNNVFISAAGNFDVTQYTDSIERNFQSFSKNHQPISGNAKYIGGDWRFNKDLEQIHFVMGFEGFSYTDDYYYTKQILCVILGGGPSSRLFQEVREKRGLAYGISAFASCYSDVGILGIYGSTTEDKINTLFDVLCEQIKIVLDGVTDEEIQRAKAQVKAGLLMSQENSISRAEKLASNLAVYGHYISVEEIIEKIERIGKHDIIDMLSKVFFSHGKPTVASIGKISKMYSYNEILEKISF